MYRYIHSIAAGCYTVGFHDPTGKWNPESDYPTAEMAAERVHYLNGGKAIVRISDPAPFCLDCARDADAKAQLILQRSNGAQTERATVNLCLGCFDKRWRGMTIGMQAICESKNWKPK